MSSEPGTSRHKHNSCLFFFLDSSLSSLVVVVLCAHTPLLLVSLSLSLSTIMMRMMMLLVSRRIQMLSCRSSSRLLSTLSRPVKQGKEEERPRLQALREQLQSETKEHSVGVGNKQQQQEQEQEQLSIQKLVQQLATLPLPPFQQLLTDSFQRHHSYLRLSLSERCNLRCQYCMPPEGITNLSPDTKLLTRQELVQLTSLFVKHGVTKVRLTGGEPLLRRDVVDIVHDVSSRLPLQQIGMTTNGITLTRHLPALVEAGLTHVNISLDTLQATKFTTLTRRPGLERVLESIPYAQELLPGCVKINCVVMRGVNDDELLDFIQLSHDCNVDVRFIEYMPFLNNGWNTNRFMSYDEMLNSIQQQQQEDYFLQRLQDGPNDTTKWYRWNNNNNNNTTARIGFITSMSHHFCGTCNRLRLTADGKLKVCLFGSQEVSLRDVLRANYPKDDQQQILERIIHFAVTNKPFRLGGHESAQAIANNAHDNRPMTLIGG